MRASPITSIQANSSPPLIGPCDRGRGDHLLASDQIAAIGDLPVADQTHDLIGDGRHQVRLEHQPAPVGSGLIETIW